MNIEILQEQLVAGISTALRAISPRAQLPVLSHVLIEADSKGITLSATDLEIGIRLRVPAKVVEPGLIAAPAKMLFEFLSSIAPGKVELTLKEATLAVKSGSYSATFATMPSSEFPQLPGFSGDVGEVETSDLEGAVERVVYAAARDGLRPVLTGVLLEFGRQLGLVCTDGFRLAIAKAGFKKSTEQGPLLVSARTMGEVVKIIRDEPIKIGYLEGSKQLLFAGKDILLVSQLIDGNFPDYAKIMPKDFETQLSVAKDELLQAVKAAHIFARDNSNMMKWVVGDGKIVVTSSSPERGECVIEVPANISSGSGGSVVFNAKFVLDYLGIVKGANIAFGMSGNLAPGMFWEDKGEAGKYVVMPINV